MGMAAKILREVVIWVFWIGAGVFASVVLNGHVLLNAQVVTASMEDTIMTRDRVFGLRIFNEIARGDIVVFYSPIPEQFCDPFIKRVVGMPGEVIEIAGGVLYIDGAPQIEAHTDTAGRDFAATIVPDNHFFVMGDNRDFSRDSREWGAVPADSIIGKVVHVLGLPLLN